MAVNKVIFEGRTLIDLTESSVTSEDLREGVIAYDKSGTRIVGEAVYEIEVRQGGIIEPIAGTDEDYLLVMGAGVVNFVSGTFTANSTPGSIQNITVPYAGTGYPIAMMIYVSGGAYNSEVTNWYNAIHHYAVGQYTMHKMVQTSAPTYNGTGNENKAVITLLYKDSDVDSTVYGSAGAMNTTSFNTSNPTANSACCKMNSNTEFSILVSDQSYGFLAGIDYDYHIVYSE